MSDITTHYHGRYLSLLEDRRWEYVSRSNASSVVVLVALTDDDELVLVEQYRRPVDARVIELPAGLVGDQDDPDESIEKAAGRELEEETGFRAGRLERVMECPSSAGMTDEIVSFVRAGSLKRVGPGGGDDSEDIEVHVVPRRETGAWLLGQLARGRMLDPKIYTALYWLECPDSIET